VPSGSDFLHLLCKVNNVGTNIRKPTTEYSAEEYSFVMATNLESAYHLCQLTHPLLKASGSGSIVFISSVCGVVAVCSGTIYAMTKGNCCSALPAYDFDFPCMCKHDVFQTYA
jgi:short-subunit dehydrogenase